MIHDSDIFSFRLIFGQKIFWEYIFWTNDHLSCETDNRLPYLQWPIWRSYLLFEVATTAVALHDTDMATSKRPSAAFRRSAELVNRQANSEFRMQRSRRQVSQFVPSYIWQSGFLIFQLRMSFCSPSRHNMQINSWWVHSRWNIKNWAYGPRNHQHFGRHNLWEWFNTGVPKKALRRNCLDPLIMEPRTHNGNAEERCSNLRGQELGEHALVVMFKQTQIIKLNITVLVQVSLAQWIKWYQENKISSASTWITNYKLGGKRMKTQLESKNSQPQAPPRAATDIMRMGNLSTTAWAIPPDVSTSKCRNRKEKRESDMTIHLQSCN